MRKSSAVPLNSVFTYQHLVIIFAQARQSEWWSPAPGGQAKTTVWSDVPCTDSPKLSTWSAASDSIYVLLDIAWLVRRTHT